MNDNFYKTTKYNISTDRRRRDLISVNFLNGCSVSINGDEDKEYSIIFYENESILYKTIIKSNHWSKTLKRYFGNYKVEIYNNGKLIKSEKLDLLNKIVLININSNSLGDSLAWIPQIDKFQKLHNCIVYVKCNWKELFEINYPNLNFCDVYGECYASYTIGYFKEWINNAPTDPRSTPLPKVASDILGMAYEELKPKLSIEPVVSNKKYVCIATQSTAQCKYWNNKSGWDNVVSYLNSLGYEVWCIDKNKTFGKHPNFNKMPKGAIDKTGDFPLSERMKQISGAEFFIGLGSGLSWLAWSLNKSVILISGFSKPLAEFDNPYRVFNEKVCNGCWNDENIQFDPSDWFWCPRGKNFECSKEISFEMVKDKIDKCLQDIKSKDIKKGFVEDVFLKKYYHLLAHRKDTFKKMFEYLESLKKEEYLIVETGICRAENSFSGDGMSSLMFDDFINYYGGRFITVDINKKNVEFAKTKLSNKSEVINSDSVVALEKISNLNKIAGVDLLYLDSFDVDWKNPHISALHHLKELVSAKNMIKDHSLIVVDDNRNNTGKGMYVNDYMSNLNKKKYFDDYQIGWVFESKKELVENFDFGNSSEKYISQIKKEIFENNVYQKFFEVEKNEIVVDLGASLGPFTFKILPKNPKICYLVEPLSQNIDKIKENVGCDRVKVIRGAISDKKEVEISWGGITEVVPAFTFREFLIENSITKIDFLKCDCEGGEYNVFHLENIEFLKTVSKIVVEFHLDGKENKSKFRLFRDNILPKFNNYEVYSFDGVNIKWDLLNEHFIEYYNEVIIHISNE